MPIRRRAAHIATSRAFIWRVPLANQPAFPSRLRCRRLTQAAYALAAGPNDILSVALDSGYASHEAFSRAFKAQFGETVRGLEKAVRNSSTHTIAATFARSSIVDRTSGHTDSPMVHCRAFRQRSCRALPL